MARILIGCECSGAVRRAFAALGHYVVSCDLKPADDNAPSIDSIWLHPARQIPTTTGWHYKGSILNLLRPGFCWDLVIAHPPCTFVCVSGLHWNKRVPGREAKTLEAITFAEQIWAARKFVRLMAVENPVGCLSTRSELGKATQYIQPYQFGHDASKNTGLWLHGLPKLVPTRYVEPRIANGAKRWANQTDSGQNKLGPSDERAALRSETYTGIAQAMADQWNQFL